MIWIIGGTSDARRLVERLTDLDNFFVSIATEEGRQFFPDDKTLQGRLNQNQMEELVKEKKVGLIIDLSHPYAKIVSNNARQVAEKAGIDYRRYIRPRVVDQEGLIYLKSYQEAYDYLADIEGTVFFTTGSKNIRDFEKVRGKNRFIYRILPAIESLEICKKYDLAMADIVALLGPFSEDFNRAMLRNYQADYCIMKDSGHAGGTREKILACQKEGVKALVIGREDEEGISNLDQIEKIIRKVSQSIL